MKTTKKGLTKETASKLYDKLLNIYTTQYDKLTKAQKNRIKVQNRPENFWFVFRSRWRWFTANAAPRTLRRSDRMKLNPRKRQNEGARLKYLLRTSY